MLKIDALIREHKVRGVRGLFTTCLPMSTRADDVPHGKGLGRYELMSVKLRRIRLHRSSTLDVGRWRCSRCVHHQTSGSHHALSTELTARNAGQLFPAPHAVLAASAIAGVDCL